MSWLASECDAPGAGWYPVALPDGTVEVRCRCLVCARCSRHTGNSTQGHYWARCAVRGEGQPFHFCCPDDCELDAEGVATLQPAPHRRTLIPPVHPDLNDVVAAHLPRCGFPGRPDPG